MIPGTAAAAGTTLDHERLQARPFRIAQQASDQGSLLKSHLESDTTAVGNPLCQHVLARSRKKLGDVHYRLAAYRPFNTRWLAYSSQINEVHYLNDQIFPRDTAANNCSITFTGPGSQKPWLSLAVDHVPDLHFVGSAAGTMELPRYRYAKSGERIDNITDWALNKFIKQYGKKGVTKDAIFHYVYARHCQSKLAPLPCRC